MICLWKQSPASSELFPQIFKSYFSLGILSEISTLYPKYNLFRISTYQISQSFCLDISNILNLTSYPQITTIRWTTLVWSYGTQFFVLSLLIQFSSVQSLLIQIPPNRKIVCNTILTFSLWIWKMKWSLYLS